MINPQTKEDRSLPVTIAKHTTPHLRVPIMQFANHLITLLVDVPIEQQVRETPRDWGVETTPSQRQPDVSPVCKVPQGSR